MMMVSDDCLVECRIHDSDEDDGGDAPMNTPPPPPPPPEFASKAPTPPTSPATPTVPPTPLCPVTRDPYGINQHLKVEVGDVLAKPATPPSPEWVWLYSVASFERSRVWTYRCVSLLLAVPFALACGVLLAVLASLHLWLVVPLVHLGSTFLPCLRSLCLFTVSELVSPLCSSVALCCSRVAVSLAQTKHRRPIRDGEDV